MFFWALRLREEIMLYKKQGTIPITLLKSRWKANGPVFKVIYINLLWAASSFIAPHFSQFVSGKKIPVRLWWRGTGKIMHHINSARLAAGLNGAGVKGVASPFSCITSRSLRKVGNTFRSGESLVYLNTYDIYIKRVDPWGIHLKNVYQKIHHSNVDLCFTTAPKTVILLNLIEILFTNPWVHKDGTKPPTQKLRRPQRSYFQEILILNLFSAFPYFSISQYPTNYPKHLGMCWANGGFGRAKQHSGAPKIRTSCARTGYGLALSNNQTIQIWRAYS